jgi:hypothetical protein
MDYYAARKLLLVISFAIVAVRIASPHVGPVQAQTNSCIEGDANQDGHINVIDFATWKRVYKLLNVNPPPSPSGQAMPIGDLPHFKQIFTEDFTQDTAVGSFPGTIYAAKWGFYPDGWPDSGGQQGLPSEYNTSKVVSVSGGILNKHLHFENGKFMASAILPKINPDGTTDQLYGKYTVRFRALNGKHGYKTAWLLWPQSEKWPDDGEIDFPEGDLDGKIVAFAHYAAPAGTNPFQDGFDSGKTFSDWHTASTEWTPGKVEFFLDDQSIGVSTAKVPSKPMHWVIQTESCLGGCPNQTDISDVQVDWTTAYAYQP